MKPQDSFIDIGIQIHIRKWLPPKSDTLEPAYLLIHGLASNARTWDQVARLLAQRGYPTVALDQRGHGLSQKPENGYNFTSITMDLRKIVGELGLHRPVLAGQSWGGNVVLDFGVRFPGTAQQLIFVDGGFLNLWQRGPWETISLELRPPDLRGLPYTQMVSQIKKSHPYWSEDGIEATMANFEKLPDGTVQPWLTLDRHMRILKALYEQDPDILYPRVQEPVLICAADDGSEWSVQKRKQVQAALTGLENAEVARFYGAAHDIHVDQPEALVARFLAFTNTITGL